MPLPGQPNRWSAGTDDLRGLVGLTTMQENLKYMTDIRVGVGCFPSSLLYSGFRTALDFVLICEVELHCVGEACSLPSVLLALPQSALVKPDITLMLCHPFFAQHCFLSSHIYAGVVWHHARVCDGPLDVRITGKDSIPTEINVDPRNPSS